MLSLRSIYVVILCLTSSALAQVTTSTLAYSTTSALAQAPTNPSCIKGWSYFSKSNKCLKVFGTKAYIDPPLTWLKAEDYCIRKGGHLAALKSEEEITFVVELTRATGYDNGDSRIFIGLVYSSISGWTHTDGTEFIYSRWWFHPSILNYVLGQYSFGMLLTRTVDTGYMWVNDNPAGNNFTAPFVCQTASSSEG